MELNSLGSIDIKWGGGRGGSEGEEGKEGEDDTEKQKLNEENLNEF